MEYKYSLLKHIKSFIYPVKLVNIKGMHLPTLEVNLRNGKLVLDGKNVNYSFGSLHHIFQNAFTQYKLVEKRIDSALVLGFGAGSIASILHNELNINCSITGIEIDPVVIELSKKYFNSNELENVKIVQEDANVFLKNDKNKYDLIVVDLFIEDRVPVKFMQSEFLYLVKQRLNPDGYLFFNRINSNPFTIHETNQLIDKMRNVFGAEISTISFEQNYNTNSVLIYHDYSHKNQYVKLKRKMERMSI